MTDQDRLEELLNRWEDLRDQKQAVSNEELCRDCPELLAEFRRRVAELKQIDGFLSCGLNEPELEDELTAAGRYRPLQLHAHGGLGEVFMARDEELGRDVALKRMRAGGRQSAAGPSFPVRGGNHRPARSSRRGARLWPGPRCLRAAVLCHAIHSRRNVAAGRRAVPPRLPARQRSGRGGIAFQKLIRSFLAVCQTIGYAHSQGVIHRDVKPANIMLGHYGETLVVDWGLAKRLPERAATGAETVDGTAAAETTVTDQTMLGQIKGSPAYMSPEQAEGRTDRIGHRSDIYSLGATLYTILAGKAPFADVEFHQLLDHVKRGDFPLPSRIRGDVSPALEAICLKAMRLDPGDRYGTALEMAADLEHWLADDRVSAWREPWTSRAKRRMRKHQTLTATVVAAALVALLGISAVVVQQHQSNQALGEKNAQLVVANQKESDQRKIAEAMEKKAQEAAEQARLEAKRAQRSEQKARRELYNFLILSADRALEAGDRGFAEDSLDQCPEELRNVEWRLLYRRAMASRQTWRIDRASIPSIARSDDGTRIAAADLNGPVLVLNVADGRLVAKLAGPARRVAFLPDGDHLLVHLVGHPAGAPGPVELWSTGQNKRVADFSLDVDHFVLSGDGKRVALVSILWPGPLGPTKEVSSRIHVCDARSGKLTALTDGIPGCVADAAFSPDHERLYAIVRQLDGKPGAGFAAVFLQGDAATSRFQLQAWNVTDSRELKLLKPLFGKDGPEKAVAVAMAISPDGKQILRLRRESANGCRRSRCVAAGDGTHHRPGRGHGRDRQGRRLRPRFARPSSRGTADRPSNLESRQLGTLAVSPDGKLLAAVSGKRILVFDVGSGKRLTELAGHLAAPQCVVFERDSKGLFSAGGEDGRIKRWVFSLPSMERTVLPSGQAQKGRGVAFSGDSRSMAVAAADGGIENLCGGDRPPLDDRPADFVGRCARQAARCKSSVSFRGERKVCRRTEGLADTILAGRQAADRHLLRSADLRLGYLRPATGGGQLHRRLGPGQRPGRSLVHPSPAVESRWQVPGQRFAPRDEPRYSCLGNRARAGWLSPTRRTSFWVRTPKMAFTKDSRSFRLERTAPNARPSVLAWDLATGKPAEVPGVTHLGDSLDQVSPDGSRLLKIVEGAIEIDDRQSRPDFARVWRRGRTTCGPFSAPTATTSWLARTRAPSCSTPARSPRRSRSGEDSQCSCLPLFRLGAVAPQRRRGASCLRRYLRYDLLQAAECQKKARL